MKAVIDVDAHFEPGGDWLAPYPDLAARLPKLEPAKLAVDAIVGDLLRDVPEDRRPPFEELQQARGQQLFEPLDGGGGGEWWLVDLVDVRKEVAFQAHDSAVSDQRPKVRQLNPLTNQIHHLTI